MATQIQLRRGNTAQTSTFTGATGEITVDTDKATIVVHDGGTAGGTPLAKESTLTSAYAHANGAFTKANQTAQLAFTTVTANGTSLVADANTDTLTITTATANGIFVTGTAGTDTLDIGLLDSGVTTAKIADGAVTNVKIDTVANTKITGLITAAQIATVANTQVTGLMTSAQIATVANTQITGLMTSAQIATVANTQITGVITTAQLAATTGSGSVVLATSPTLVTPALGTPSALVGTNISGTATAFTASNVTTNANLTGGVTSVGNAATVVTNANLTGHVTSVGNAAVLGSFSSAQLATALTDETGTGFAVFATSPALTTPLLGTPTSGVLTNCTSIPAAQLTGTVAVANGGTGAATLTANYVLLGNTTSAPQMIAPGTATNVLTSDGTTWASAAAPGGGFAATTVMIFVQTSAPTGWTKVTGGLNDAALRVVSGTAGSGGTVAFTTAFVSQAVAGTNASGAVSATTLTTAQMPAHTHDYTNVHAFAWVYTKGGSYGGGTSSTSSTGGGGSHTHSFTQPTFSGTAINLAVKYLDVIYATKN